MSNTDNGRCRGDETADPTATLATCLICGLPLDPVMAATGGTTHPSCDPRRLLALRNEETR